METTPMTISPIALLAAFFLPLFPFSMVFNAALRAVRLVWLRAALLLIWPQIGEWLLAGAGMHLPQAWMSAGLARAMPRPGTASTPSVLSALGAPVFPVFFALIYLLGLCYAATVVSVLGV